jgi:NarL family two-component system response regulator LiaR
MTAPIRVLIVDDHDMLREGLATFLQAFSDMEQVGEAANGAEAVARCRELSPDVVLMDLVMPEMDGVAAIRAIHAAQPRTAIIALSSFGEERLVRAALAAGARSYLLKNVSADSLAEAIRLAVAGISTLSPEAAALVAGREPAAPDELTPREREILRLLIDGRTNAEIAAQLGLSLYTVKNHVRNLLGKLGVGNRTEAVSLALQRGLQ